MRFGWVSAPPTWVGHNGVAGFCLCPHPPERHRRRMDGSMLCLEGLCPCRGRETEERTPEGRVDLWEPTGPPIGWEPRQTKPRG